MTLYRAECRTQGLLVADRPSRRMVAPAAAPDCPRCHTAATGLPGRWWCGECSSPVTEGRA